MKIISISTREVVAEVMTNHSMSLDEALRLVGEVDRTAEQDEVTIDGVRYDYADLDMEWN